MAALVSLASDRFGGLDVLVSCAGVAPISPFSKVQLADWTAMIDVNVKGVLHGVAAALPVCERQGSGHFVNIISTAGIQMIQTMGVYSASKNAVRTISEGLRIEANGKYRVTGAFSSTSWSTTPVRACTANSWIAPASRRAPCFSSTSSL